MAAPEDQPRQDMTQTDAEPADSEEALDDIPQEVMERLPPEAKKLVEKMSLSMMHRVGPAPNPVLQKVTPEHISRVLDLSEKDAELTFKDALYARFFTAFYVLLFVLLLAALAWFLVPIDKELFIDVFKILAIFAGGFGSGFGVKSYIDRRSAS